MRSWPPRLIHVIHNQFHLQKEGLAVDLSLSSLMAKHKALSNLIFERNVCGGDIRRNAEVTAERAAPGAGAGLLAAKVDLAYAWLADYTRGDRQVTIEKQATRLSDHIRED
ncbi:hypothetical protein EVAR_32758_1 [Eumeta japonica]|uniref:Uncharacterized protein n=1 Tax=Eumeta variegata TaxID=151549 RepID=A0A4C1XN91_EUMVA|nr:hypothetical protein EVAR_32758_1 [Eumeta japonica]